MDNILSCGCFGKSVEHNIELQPKCARCQSGDHSHSDSVECTSELRQHCLSERRVAEGSDVAHNDKVTAERQGVAATRRRWWWRRRRRRRTRDQYHPQRSRTRRLDSHAHTIEKRDSRPIGYAIDRVLRVRRLVDGAEQDLILDCEVCECSQAHSDVHHVHAEGARELIKQNLGERRVAEGTELAQYDN